MAQIKIYLNQKTLAEKRRSISDAIHASVIQALQYPAEKRFQRFIALKNEDFIYPDDRSDQYLIIEISLFSGRSVAAKKALIRQIYTELAAKAGIHHQDVEITLFETPKENWGIRGLPGDELALSYNVEV